MPNKPIKLVLVEDHLVTMTGLRDALASFPEVEVIGAAYDSDGGLELMHKLKPDAVLLDLHLPGSRGPKSTVEEYCKSKSAKIIVFSSESGPAFVQAVVKAGASGYLLKSEPPQRIVEVLTECMISKSPILSKELFDTQAPLTKVEYQILMHLARGKKYHEIAEARSTSRATIKRQCEMLQTKLNLETREELIAWAANNGYGKLEGNTPDE